MTKGNQGISSKNVRHTTAPKVEPKAYAKRPAGAAALGSFYGDHSTNRPGSSGYRGEKLDGGRGYQNPVGPTSMALSGPGAGREVLRSGGQGTRGSVNPGNPRPAGKDILREFGPDKRSY